MSVVDAIIRRITTNFGSPHCTQQCTNQPTKNSVRKLDGNKGLIGLGDEDEEFTIGPDDTNQDADSTYDAVRDTKLVGKLYTPGEPRVFIAPVAPPQDLHFIVPPLDQNGALRRCVCVNG